MLIHRPSACVEYPLLRAQGLVIGRVGEPGLPAVEVVGELLVERPDADQHRRPGPRPPLLGPQLNTASPQFFPLRSIRTTARYTKPGLAAVTKATERLDPPHRRS
jgi:hypothetical protein